ncbi:MAG: S8 family serine peptidase [Sulfuricellaceae bacterium]
MKRIKQFILWLALVLPCAAQVLDYDANRRVYWSSGAIYTRDEYHWFVRNTGQPSRLFLNGVYQSEETGNWDLNMTSAWAIQPNANGVRVAVVDVPGSHANRIVQLIQLIAPGAVVTLYPVSRYYPDVVGPMLYNACVSNRIVVLATGWATPDLQIEMALHMGSTYAVVVCSAPNNPQSMDVIPDYPYSYHFPNVLAVNALDRAGAHYWSGYGVNVIGAPGRNVTGDGVTYSSGCSYAAPIAAGCVALLIAKKPDRIPRFYVEHALKWSTPAGLTRRINPVAMLTNLRVPEP